jgi:hypothetical protein
MCAQEREKTSVMLIFADIAKAPGFIGFLGRFGENVGRARASISM